MADDFQDKTEEPTEKKLEDSKKKGQVSKSQDFNTGVLLIAGMGILYSFSNFFEVRLASMMTSVFRSLNGSFIETHDSVAFWASNGIYFLVVTMIPIFVVVVVLGVLVNLVQVGVIFSTESLKPKWKNLNVFNLASYKKFFNSQAVMKLVFGLSKLSIIGVVCGVLTYQLMPEISNLMHATPAIIFYFLAYQAFKIGLIIAIILLILGVGDYIFQKWKFLNDMKMTKQEIKDERKQSEGDAQIKGKQRSIMQSMSQSRMKENVPHADVVIANPIHYAIAIKYDAEKMGAPICLAKGARKVALSIKEIAKDNNVPIVENPLLARALFKVVEVGMLIPPDFYHSIAEVLAYVYRVNEELKNKNSKKILDPIR